MDMRSFHRMIFAVVPQAVDHSHMAIRPVRKHDPAVRRSGQMYIHHVAFRAVSHLAAQLLRMCKDILETSTKSHFNVENQLIFTPSFAGTGQGS